MARQFTSHLPSSKRTGNFGMCGGGGLGGWGNGTSEQARPYKTFYDPSPSQLFTLLPSPHSWFWSDGISIIADGSSPRRPPPGAPFDDFGAADVHAGHRLQQQQLHPHPHHPRQQSPRCRAQQAAAAAAASASNFCTMRRTGASGVLHSGGGRRAVQFADQPIMQQTRKSSVSINKFVDVQCLMVHYLS